MARELPNPSGVTSMGPLARAQRSLRLGSFMGGTGAGVVAGTGGDVGRATGGFVGGRVCIVGAGAGVTAVIMETNS